jgi:hypothetical protein
MEPNRPIQVSYEHPEAVDESHAELIARVDELGQLRAAAAAAKDNAAVARIDAELTPLFRRHDQIMRAAGRLPAEPTEPGD